MEDNGSIEEYTDRKNKLRRQATGNGMQESYSDYNIKLVREYSNILENRKIKSEIVNEQMQQK